jgi:hypothetical protein
MKIQLKKVAPEDVGFFLEKCHESFVQGVLDRFGDAERWETCTPYFERRNIHFYLHKCGFKIVEFFSEFHREEHDLTDKFKDINTSGFFRFEKVMKPDELRRS